MFVDEKEFKQAQVYSILLKNEIKIIKTMNKDLENTNIDTEFEKNMLKMYYGNINKNIKISPMNDYSILIPIIKKMTEINFLMFLLSIKDVYNQSIN